MRHPARTGLAVLLCGLLGLAVWASAATAASRAAVPKSRRPATRRCAGCAARRAAAAPACLALKLKAASPGSPGALPYVLAAGARSKGPAGGLTPADLASAYSVSPTATGSGQTVAIVDAYDDPKIEEDLATFDTQYGLPACTAGNGCFTKVGQTGSTSSLPPADTSGWSVEIAPRRGDRAQRLPELQDPAGRGQLRNRRRPRGGGQRGGRAGRRRGLQLLRLLEGEEEESRPGHRGLRPSRRRDRGLLGRLGLLRLGRSRGTGTRARTAPTPPPSTRRSWPPGGPR